MSYSINDYEKDLDKWKIWLRGQGNSVNHISNQLVNLTEDYRNWQVLINAARIGGNTEKADRAAMNGYLQKIIDYGFWSKHHLDISILSLNEKFSLKTILNDIKSNQKNITRKLFITQKFPDIEYKDHFDEDIENARQDFFNEIEPDDSGWVCEKKTGTIWNYYQDAERQQCEFDNISQKEKNERSENDIMSDMFFDDLYEKLDSCQPSYDYALASIINRSMDPIPKIKITMNKIEGFHEALWYVFHSLNITFFDSGTYPILGGYGYRFQGLNLPYVSEETLQDMKDLLEKLEEDDAKRLRGRFMK